MNFDLDRFKKAQDRDYSVALAEIKAGRKQSHWIWYVFPQLKGLGFSSTSQFYGLDGMAESQAYFADPILRSRLMEISEVLLALPDNDATRIMGYPDDLKLKSCMTLFAEVAQQVAPEIELFDKILEKFFGGQKDEVTIKLLAK